MPIEQQIAILVELVTCVIRITGEVPSVTTGASVIVPEEYFQPPP
jgi:hypothetical protein